MLVTMCAGGEAQVRPGLDPLGRPGPPPLQLPPAQPSPPLPQPILPPLPSEPPAATPQFPQVRVFVQAIRITGSTVFSQEDLAKVTAPYVNRELTTEDLEALRLALTRLYIDAGYINSGAVIPDQTVRDGVITMQIIEGELTAIEITGNRWSPVPQLATYRSMAHTRMNVCPQRVSITVQYVFGAKDIYELSIV